MSMFQWGLEGAVVILLLVTLLHVSRLQRALGVLRRDRAALEALITGFNDSTHQAERGIERLRAASEGAGRQIVRHIDQAKSLKDDLIFLADRAEQVADRMENLLRHGRTGDAMTAAPTPPTAQTALQPPAPAVTRTLTAPPSSPQPPALARSDADDRERVRSEAERDLLRALKLAR